MSKRFPIINPQASNVIGMYLNELVGMDHPVAGIRLTSKNDAYLCYQQAIPLKAAIKSILAQIRYLFEEDIPEELVMATVYLVYAENTALKVRKTPIDDIPVDEKPIVRQPVHHRPSDIHKEYVSLWLKCERSIRGSESLVTFKARNAANKKHYPKLAFNANNIAGGFMEIPENATINEILAQALRVVIGTGIRSYIYLSEFEIIKIIPPGYVDSYKDCSHIVAYDRVLIFPENTTKDELIEIATKIAATWCPMACVIWSENASVQDCNCSNRRK